MTDNEGPWGDAGPPPRRPIRRLRLALWLGLLALAGAAVWLLWLAFPGQLSDLDRGFVWYDVGLFALVSSGVVFASRRRLGEAARHAAIWCAVIAILVLGYTFRDQLVMVGLKVRAELIPAYAVAGAPHTLIVNQSDDGNFYVMGDVNGIPVRFLIDTGASDIALCRADAKRLGIDLATLRFDHTYETANGTGYGASLTVDRLNVGPIHFSRVPVSINRADMATSLLGMTFLKRLDGFEIRKGRLILRYEP
ncbi:MAG: TIGR02281 family clan AA aspartic protease [Pseudomonadota bacterium]|nr:TIGR02281 family clan AA aspartic protease [Pseudomonadota bacterium]